MLVQKKHTYVHMDVPPLSLDMDFHHAQGIAQSQENTRICVHNAVQSNREVDGREISCVLQGNMPCKTYVLRSSRSTLDLQA